MRPNPASVLVLVHEPGFLSLFEQRGELRHPLVRLPLRIPRAEQVVARVLASLIRGRGVRLLHLSRSPQLDDNDHALLNAVLARVSQGFGVPLARVARPVAPTEPTSETPSPLH